MVRIAILELTITIKMAKDCKEGLGWPQVIRGPPFLSLGHTHDREPSHI
jgi:hypothetical protein